MKAEAESRLPIAVQTGRVTAIGQIPSCCAATTELGRLLLFKFVHPFPEVLYQGLWQADLHMRQRASRMSCAFPAALVRLAPAQPLRGPKGPQSNMLQI